MATKNEDLIGETAEALLNAIKEKASTGVPPEDLRFLADAFAAVATNDLRVKAEGGRERVTR